MTIPGFDPRQPKAFEHDPSAAAKVVGLQVLALDLLKLGWTSNELSDREKAAFGLEFGEVGMKVLEYSRMGWGKGKEVAMVDLARLEMDMQDIIGESVGCGRDRADTRYRLRGNVHT